MKYLGLDGRQYTLTFNSTIRGTCSSYHLRARQLLKDMFPFDRIFEEIALPGVKSVKNGQLYLDFLIPSKDLAIEVQGEQHSKYTPFFHDNKLDFGRAQFRDNRKREWCEMNNITLIELNFDEDDNEWRCKIENR